MEKDMTNSVETSKPAQENSAQGEEQPLNEEELENVTGGAQVDYFRNANSDASLNFSRGGGQTKFDPSQGKAGASGDGLLLPAVQPNPK